MAATPSATVSPAPPPIRPENTSNSIAIRKPYIACVSDKAENIIPLANMSESSATAPTAPAAAIPCPKPDPNPAKPTATPAPIAAKAVPNSTTILFTS